MLPIGVLTEATGKWIRSMELRVVFSALLVAAMTSSCKDLAALPRDYVAICTGGLSVVEFSSDHPRGQVIYELKPEGSTMITSVAIDPHGKRYAIAKRSKESVRGTATIDYLDSRTCEVVQTIKTRNDDIQGMAFARDGKLAFVAADLVIKNPGELCYADAAGASIQVVAKGKNFIGPCWNASCDSIYFASYLGGSREVGRVEIGKIGMVTKIADGTSVTVLGSGEVVYLSMQGQMFLLGGDGSAPPTLVNMPPKFTDVRTIDRIRAVSGTKDIALQRYVKGIGYDLFIAGPPYGDAALVLKNVGMIDFDVALMKGTMGSDSTKGDRPR